MRYFKTLSALVCVEFINMHFLLPRQEYMVFVETIRKYPFLVFITSVVFYVFSYLCPVYNICQELPVYNLLICVKWM
jgi:hypothetical protein